MLHALLPSLLVMLAAVFMISLGRGMNLLEPSRPPRLCPACGRIGEGADGCSCA